MINQEIRTVQYWVHIVIIVLIVLGILQFVQGGSMLTVKNVLWSIPLLGFADYIGEMIKENLWR